MLLIAVVIIAGCASLFLSRRDWRQTVYWLLVYLPYAGILTLLLYPAPPVTRVVKDVVFIAPLYIGLAAEFMRKRPGNAEVTPSIRVAMLLTGVIVLAQAFNSELNDPVVALIGIKTWIFYFPLIFVGRYLITSREDLDRVFHVIALVGVPPLVIGVAQAILLYAGRGDLAYAVYGEAAANAVTQSFSGAEFSTGAQMTKTPGIFTFVTQYYNFTLAMIAVGFGLGFGTDRYQRLGLMLMALASIAGLLSGARGAYIMVPVLLVAASAMAEGFRRVPFVVAVITIAFTLSFAITRAPIEELGYMIRVIAFDYAIDVPIEQMRIAGSEGLWGHGTGISNGGAGQIVESRADYSGAPLWVIGVETYFAKALLELGLPGLVVVTFLLFAILFEGARGLLRLRDRKLKAYTAALLAFLLVGVLNEWKGPYLDLDPLNVYFWLFSGIMFRLPSLERQAVVTQPSRLASPASPWRAGVISPFASQRTNL